MQEFNYPISLRLRIDWADLDYFAHVNNVSFYRYIQAARVNYWDTIGLSQSHRETNIGPLLASCKCDFKKPLFYPGQVEIRSSVNFIKTTSFGIQHQLLNEKGEIAAVANDVLVMYDFNKNEKAPITPWLINKIQKIEGRTF